MSYVGWAVLLICVMAVGTLFFSVSVISLRTFSQARLQEAFKAAGRADFESLAERLTAEAERLILACSLYRLILNMAMLLLVMSIFATLRRAEPTQGDYVLTFLIATGIFSVFGLAIPHAWAKYAGERTLSRTYGLLRALAGAASPALRVLKLHDGLVRRLANVPQTSPEERQEERQEEFLTGLDQHRIEGTVDKEEQEMIKNVLELSETTADAIMTQRTDIVAVEVKSDLATVLETVIRAGYSRVPVYEETIDNIVGLIYAKDLLSEIGKNAADFKLRDRMRQVYFVPETKPLRGLLHEFQNQKLHIAVVLDEYGGTAGIVTMEDILEELVGEISDEYEGAPAEPIKGIDQNTIEVDARTYVDYINDRLECNVPEDEDYDTIGGFVLSRLGYIPASGETFDYEGLRFTIASAEARRIRHIRIQKLT